MIVAQFLHVRPGALAGDPPAVVIGSGDFAVERDGGLERHQRPAGAHEMNERLIELGGLGREFGGELNFDAGLAQLAEAFAADARVGVFHGSDHLGNTRRDQRIGARRRAALVRTGLQVQVDSGAARTAAGLLHGDGFRVL